MNVVVIAAAAAAVVGVDDDVVVVFLNRLKPTGALVHHRLGVCSQGSGSKLVVDKKPLSQVIQDLEVTPDVLSDMQRKDESLRSSFQAAEKGEVRSAGDTSSYFYLSEGILYRSLRKAVSQFLKWSFQKVFERQFWQFLTMPF